MDNARGRRYDHIDLFASLDADDRSEARHTTHGIGRYRTNARRRMDHGGRRHRRILLFLVMRYMCRHLIDVRGCLVKESRVSQ